ncbi:MAG TPA: DUF2231 domain-containing protein [Gemmatimonadales bacterium]|nr:DUF2231 domain-containing protein [Gemmatimonadales bacterium]
MPNIAVFHPQIVHFVIALFFVGLALRIASWFIWPTWTKPAGALLLILSAFASVAAVRSGTEAHGPVERIPGAREIVEHHEERGEAARNLMLIIAALELVALALAKQAKAQKALHVISGVFGLYVGFSLYEAAEHGGEIVYEYGGGPGVRSNDTTDIRRLLVAGLYNQAQRDREAGRSEEAARLIDELARRMPGDQTVVFLAIESKIKDRKDPQGALAELAAISFPADQPRIAIRHALLTAEAWKSMGMPDSAKAILESLQRKYPDNPGVQRAIENFK